MKKKYLITGGLGFLGKAITKNLIEQNNSVIIVDNQFRHKDVKKLNYNNCKIYNIDIRNKTLLSKVAKNVDAVIHLAAINGTNYFYEQPLLVLEVALKGIMNILEICEKKKIPEFFLASSSEVYHNAPYIPADEKVPLTIPDPMNPRYTYSAGKIISEIMLLNTNFFERFIIFRPHNIYGPNMGFNHVIPEIIMKLMNAKNNLVIQGSGNHTRSFCYIDDFVRGFNILLKKGKNKNIYNIGTQDEIKIIKLINKLIKISNKKLLIKKTKEKSGNPSRRCPDISKIRKLGFNPTIDLDAGLKKTLQWYKI
jgi:nucleoside-diphosphate-sugar epimerase